jgi:periplasmic protein TonB
MFEQSLIQDAAERRSPWSFAASLSLQCVLLTSALVIPVLHVAKLDTKLQEVIFFPRPVGKPDLPQQPTKRQVTSSTILANTSNRSYRPFQAPTHIPTQVATGPDLPNAPLYDFGTASNSGGGVSDRIGLPALFDLGTKMVAIAPPVPAPKPPQPVQKSNAPLRVGEGVQAAKLVFGPKPSYPPLARQARISGVVRLAARISTDGHIQDLRLVSGHPMLSQAAIDAVRQWVYKPTLLNREPVEVLTEIMVNFTLNQ